MALHLEDSHLVWGHIVVGWCVLGHVDMGVYELLYSYVKSIRCFDPDVWFGSKRKLRNSYDRLLAVSAAEYP